MTSASARTHGGRNGKPFGVASRPINRWCSIRPGSPYAQLHAALMKRFAGRWLLLDFTRDTSGALWTSGDAPRATTTSSTEERKQDHPGGSRRLWFEGKKLAAMNHRVKTRDGATIFGYYTAPAARNGSTPMVVMPHGGPSVRRYMGSIRRAVSRQPRLWRLQVNYRGSGGRATRS